MNCTLEARNRYFSMYAAYKHKACYYKHYQIRSKQINGVITGVCAVFSVTSIASWAIWNYIPWAWVCVVIFMQILQTISPYLPYTKQLVALKFLLPQLDQLLLEIDAGWRNIEDYEDKKVNSLIDKYQKKYIELDTLYRDDTYFPMIDRCDKKAERDCDIYFQLHYKARKEVLNG